MLYNSVAVTLLYFKPSKDTATMISLCTILGLSFVHDKCLIFTWINVVDINRFIANLIPYINSPLCALHLHQSLQQSSCTLAIYNIFLQKKKFEAPVDPLWLKKKSEEKFECPNPISGWCKFNQFFLCGLPYLVDSYNKKMVCFGEGVMELYMCENAIFFLPVNMPTVWCTGFLGHMTHYHVSWYFYHVL